MVEVSADVSDGRRVDDRHRRTFFAETFSDPVNEVAASVIPVVLVATLGLRLADNFAWNEDILRTGCT